MAINLKEGKLNLDDLMDSFTRLHGNWLVSHMIFLTTSLLQCSSFIQVSFDDEIVKVSSFNGI